MSTSEVGMLFFSIFATRRPPTSTLFPYTTLFRSAGGSCSPAPATPARTASRCSAGPKTPSRSEEHTSELQSHSDLVCRLLLEKKKDSRGDDCAVDERIGHQRDQRVSLRCAHATHR